MTLPESPGKITLEITRRCNARCDFCYLLGSGRLQQETDELTLAEIKGFLKAVAPGTEFYITGGEPLIREDCEDIISAIKTKGFSCGLNTNGTLLSRGRVRRLKGIDYILVSLHGLKAVHESLTHLERGYARVLQGIERLLNDLPFAEVILTCTIDPANMATLDKIYLLGKKLGVHRVIFEHAQFLRPGEFSGDAFLMPVFGGRYAADIRAFERKMRLLKDKLVSRPVPLQIRPSLSGDRLKEWYADSFPAVGRCLATLRTMAISPDGSVRICPSYEKAVGNIRERPYREIWNSREMVMFRQETGKRGLLRAGCARCCHRFALTNVAGMA